MLVTTQNDDGWFVDHIFNGPFFFKTPKHVAAAVSGGGDSMALLSYLQLWAKDKDITVSAITVDHGLRPEAKGEAAMVAAFCADRAIAHKTLRWSGWTGEGNLQAEASKARYRLMADYAKEAGIDTIALGHTEDDQAETFLMRLARKSGVDGLASMNDRFMRDGIDWVRPLLQRSRARLREHLRLHDIKWIEDPSNDDMRFDRVKARDILAKLEPLGIDANTLSSVSHNLMEAQWVLDHYAFQEAERLVEVEGGDLVITRTPIPPVPGEIERRLLNDALQYVASAPYPPRRRALMDLEGGFLEGKDTQTLGGCLLTRTQPDGILSEKLRVSREYAAVADIVTPTDQLWDGRWNLNGPHDDALQIRALGDAGLKLCADWRDTKHPRTSLISSPAIWHGEELVAAPLAGLENGWKAGLNRTFHQFLLDRQTGY